MRIFALIKNGYQKVFVTLALSCALSACATIGAPSVQLSSEVGNRIADMQSIHVAAIDAYFDVEVGRIEDFLRDTWEPLFLKNFLGLTGILVDLQSVSGFTAQQREELEIAISEHLDDPDEAPQVIDRLIQALDRSRRNEPELIRDVLNDFVEDRNLSAATIHVSSLLASDEPARMIIDFAEDAHVEMLAQRKALLEPIEAQRKLVRSEVQAAYAELTAAQGLITGRLAAASRVKQEQDAIFDSLLGEGSADAIRNKLAGISQDVGEFLNEANNLELVTEDGEVDLSSLLRDKLND